MRSSCSGERIGAGSSGGAGAASVRCLLAGLMKRATTDVLCRWRRQSIPGLLAQDFYQSR